MMNKLEILKKKLLYRSSYRGSKEMDLLLGNFVKKYVNFLSENELRELESLLNTDDEILYKWYLNQDTNKSIPENNITKKLKKFKL